jgi:hypothetical protein
LKERKEVVGNFNVDVENFRRNRVEDVEEILKGLVEKGI